MESLKLKSKSVIGLILIISIGFFSFWASSLNADPVDLFLRGLNSDQIKAFKKVASNEICPCGLPVTLLGCIAPGKNCEESRLMSVVLKELVKSNTPKDSLESKFSEVFSPISGKKNKLSVNTAHCIGDPKAEFEIIEYSDFQCPHCKMAVSQLKALTMSKAFKVKVCFRPYPLSGHVLAEKASLIALSIKNSQKFWLFHDQIFANQDNLTEEVIYKIETKKFEF